MSESAAGGYSTWRRALSGLALPAAVVDLAAFDANAKALAARARGKPLRLATKSVRSVPLVERVLRREGAFRGLMAFHAAEAAELARRGFDDVLVAYPAWGDAGLGAVAAELAAGRRITLMVDSPEHVARLAALAAARGVTVPVCLDLDVSSVYPGLHFGVRRSPLREPADVVALARRVQDADGLRLEGLMAYEAQVAGVPDEPPGPPGTGAAVRYLKRRAVVEAAHRRRAAVEALRADGHALRFVNGGGTGSLESTSAEEVVTEATAGSGLFAPALFDGYRGFRHRPAAAFALEVVRRPSADVFTCLGGGYVASGAAGPDKLPRPFLPEGAALLPHEGAGEVQTPVRYSGTERLDLGDPVLFRHAKAGELCERFSTLLLVEEGVVVDEVKTYRGEGWAFA